jgi:ribonuclease HI
MPKGTPVQQFENEALVWTDGACSGNPGPGGWAAIVVPAGGGDMVELSGGDPRGCASCPPAGTPVW